jgi:hypothetical protein
LEFASGNAQSQKQALFGSFSLSALTLDAAKVDSAHDQPRGENGYSRPAEQVRWSQGLIEDFQPQLTPRVVGLSRAYLRGTGQDAVDKTLRRFLPSECVPEFVVETGHKLIFPISLS